MIKLAKCGGIREALRMIHAARALDLEVMLGCMIESELGIAQAAQLGSLADYIDLDGHLLISNAPFTGLGPGGRAAGALGRRRAWAWSRHVADRLALFTGGVFAESQRQDRARHPALRDARGRVRRGRGRGGRGRVRGRALRAPRRCRSWRASPRPWSSARTYW